MLYWLAENGGTLLIGTALLLIVGAAVRSMFKNRKKARSSGGCSGGCAGCSLCGSCRPVESKK